MSHDNRNRCTCGNQEGDPYCVEHYSGVPRTTVHYCEYTKADLQFLIKVCAQIAMDHPFSAAEKILNIDLDEVKAKGI